MIVHSIHPARLAESERGANLVRDTVRRALARRGEEDDYREKHALQIRRGPYVATRVMTESVSDQPVTVDGTYIDLFDAALPIVRNPVVLPGAASLLYDLHYATTALAKVPGVAVSSSRIRDEKAGNGRLAFVSEAPAGITVSTRLLLAKEPGRVTADGKEVTVRSWDPGSRTLLIRYDGVPEGTHILVEEES
ncbi:hypothetical protein [Gordoniibacillus kamchatkensis]|uniref:hypothetical protein n=1 Tax=Gordoniibacillus kamchatkensis TaxID=1590651 RepID=UPI000696E77F|nr:hypothetical protein [Paenibacillus sp. VKM B-2647]